MEELNAWYPEPPPGENAADGYAKAFALSVYDEAQYSSLPFVGDGEAPPLGEPLAEDIRRKLEAYLEENAEAARLLHKAAKMPNCRFPVDFTRAFQAPFPFVHPHGWYGDRPYHKGLINATRQLYCEAVIMAETGKPAGIVEAIVTMLRVGQSLRNEPLMESQGRRMGMQIEGIWCLSYVLSRTKLETEHLEEIADALGNPLSGGSLLRAAVAQRCIGSAAFVDPKVGAGLAELIDACNKAARSQLKNPRTIASVPILPRVNPPPMTWRFRSLGLLDLEHLHFLKHMKSYIEEWKNRDPDYRQVDDICPRFAPKGKMPPLYFPFIFWFYYDWPCIESSTEWLVPKLELACLALTIERYRNDIGELPSSLNELVPEYLDSVPLDPFDGEAVRYKRLDKGYVVYSVGDDKKDDGANQEYDEDYPDIIFRVAR